MDPDPDVIRHEIEKTRSSLTDKLETLEEQVKETVSSVTHSVEETIESVKDRVQGTVESVTSTVQGTVETVKSTVGETVETVKRTFDLPYQTERHPFAMTGGSALLGLLIGYSLGGRSRRRSAAPSHLSAEPAWDEGLRQGYEPASPVGYEAAAAFSAPPPPPPQQPRRQEPSLLSRLLQPFAAEIDKVKEVAVGGLLSMVRDSVVKAVPPGLAQQVEQIMNDLTHRLGGKPVQGPVMPEQPAPGTEHNGH